jgi:hypothetical protein
MVLVVVGVISPLVFNTAFASHIDPRKFYKDKFMEVAYTTYPSFMSLSLGSFLAMARHPHLLVMTRPLLIKMKTQYIILSFCLCFLKLFDHGISIKDPKLVYRDPIEII